MIDDEMAKQLVRPHDLVYRHLNRQLSVWSIVWLTNLIDWLIDRWWFINTEFFVWSSHALFVTVINRLNISSIFWIQSSINLSIWLINQIMLHILIMGHVFRTAARRMNLTAEWPDGNMSRVWWFAFFISVLLNNDSSSLGRQMPITDDVWEVRTWHYMSSVHRLRSSGFTNSIDRSNKLLHNLPQVKNQIQFKPNDHTILSRT